MSVRTDKLRPPYVLFTQMPPRYAAALLGFRVRLANATAGRLFFFPGRRESLRNRATVQRPPSAQGARAHPPPPLLLLPLLQPPLLLLLPPRLRPTRLLPPLSPPFQSIALCVQSCTAYCQPPVSHRACCSSCWTMLTLYSYSPLIWTYTMGLAAAYTLHGLHARPTSAAPPHQWSMLGS